MSSDDRMSSLDLAALFAAGAYSAVSGSGMSRDDAMRFVSGVCKQAAARHVVIDDDDLDEESTWWDRNKSWLKPTGIGLGAFLLGADAGRNGDPQGNYFGNAFSLFINRLGKLFGIVDDPYYRSFTETKKAPAPSAYSGATDNKGREMEYGC